MRHGRQTAGGVSLRKHFMQGSLADLAAITQTADSQAGKTIHFLVLKEHGVGSAAQAQPYVDKLVALAAKKNDWGTAEGKYVTSRDRGEKYIKENKPEFGLVSLGAFLDMKKKHGLEVLGSVAVSQGGGRQYHVVSKNAGSLKACKGKKLATNHAEDGRFIDKVVAGGDFTLGDFTVEKTKRPVQTIKMAISGDAPCALIDDAQFGELTHIEGGSSLKSVWKSKMLPPMPVVAFPSAPAALRAKFKASLGSICAGAGKAYCDKVGISALKEGDESTYSDVLKAYGK